MAKNSVPEWDTTANNNTDIGGTDIDEGCAPSGINNALRTMMAQIRSGVPVKVSSSTDNALVRFDGATGQFQNSGVTLSDSAVMSGLGGLVMVGSVYRNNNTSSLNIAGGSAAFTGSNWTMYGSSHTSQASDASLAVGTNLAYYLDISEATHTFYMPLDTARLTLSTSGVAAVGTLSATGAFSAASVAQASFSTTGASAGTAYTSNVVRSSVASTAGTAHYGFYNPNGLVGSITTSGSATSFNTASDERLKVNFRDFDSGDIIDGINVYLFDWNAGGTGYGVKAQELVDVFPDAVLQGSEAAPGEEDFMPWGVDLSKLVPVLLREVQNLRERLAAAGL